MSEFANLSEFRTFRSKHWSEKSGWRFRVKLTAGDRESIQLMTAGQGIDMARMSDEDRKRFSDYLQAMRDGRRPDEMPDISIPTGEARHTAEVATVARLSRGWWGPDLVAPEGGLYVKHGEVIDPEDEPAKKGAVFFPEGQVLPCNEDTIALLGPELMDEVTDWLNPYLRPRSRTEQAEFQSGPRDTAQSGDSGQRDTIPIREQGTRKSRRTDGESAQPAVVGG